MGDNIRFRGSRFRIFQYAVATLAVVWALNFHIKNMIGPKRGLNIDGGKYEIPRGCSINGIEKVIKLDKLPMSERKFESISKECLIDKYKISDEIAAKYNFHSVRYFGRNYYRIGNDAVNVQCNQIRCFEVGRHVGVFMDYNYGVSP